MIPTSSLQNQVELKEMELSALLEITQAINNNLSEEALYKIYNFTLRANLQIKKLALYVFEDQWRCKVNFGTQHNFEKQALDPYLLDIHDVCYQCTDVPDSAFAEFDTVIPIKHKNNLLAMVLIGGLSPIHQTETNFIEALSNIMIVAIENKRMARRQLEQEALRKEMEIAQQVQLQLFPKNLPQTPNCSISAFYLPHKNVGGDYYDYVAIDENTHLICIADVSGKGMPAAILMSNFQACLRTLLRQSTDLTFIVNELNHQVFQSANGENFITFFAGIYYKDKNQLHYVNAGHNPPVLLLSDSMQYLSKGTTVLGALNPLPFIEQASVENLKEFTLFCYTDGVTETFNEAGEEFGEDRMISILTRFQKEKPDHIHAALMLDLHKFKVKTDFKDDITMVSMQLKF